MDLRENVVSSLNHNFYGQGIGPRGARGTMVAGLIAAQDNAHGGRGVAPEASIYSYNLLAREPTTEQILEAMTLNLTVTAVSNNHWGRDDYGLPQPAAPGWEAAIREGVTDGFGGLGISYVTAGGSGAEQTDDSNLDGYANHYGVIAVCAVDYGDTRPAYSEEGANLWVCAPQAAGTMRRRSRQPLPSATRTSSAKLLPLPPSCPVSSP